MIILIFGGRQGHCFAFIPVFQLSRRCFTCAVVSILVQLVTWGALAGVPSSLISAVVFAVTVVHEALVNICKHRQL